MRMCDLADSVLLSRSGMSRLVDRLERDGLLVPRRLLERRPRRVRLHHPGGSRPARAGPSDARRRHPPPLPRAVRRGRAAPARRVLAVRLLARRACRPGGAAPSPLGSGAPWPSRSRHPSPRPGSRARAGVLRLAHGEVRTPAFVPLATKAIVKGHRAARGRRARLRHGARQHVPPVPRRRATSWSPSRAACTSSCAGRRRSSPTPAASRSSRWATARSPTRSRAGRRTAPSAPGAILAIEEEGVRFRSYIDGGERFMAPETSMEVQAALGSDIALVVRRVHAVPRRPRLHRALDRAHAPLARALPATGTTSTGRGDQASTAIVPGRRLRGPAARLDAQAVAASRCAGHRDRRLARRREGADVRGRGLGDRRAGRGRTDKPRHLLGIGEIDDLVRGVELGIDTFDCAMPTRLGRHGDGARARPRAALARRPHEGPLEARARADHGGLPVPGVRGRLLARATCTTCSRARELTALRLVTLHNLAFVARLMADLRAAIAAGDARRGRGGGAGGRARRRGAERRRYCVFSSIRSCSCWIACCASSATTSLQLHRVAAAAGRDDRDRGAGGEQQRARRAARRSGAGRGAARPRRRRAAARSAAGAGRAGAAAAARRAAAARLRVSAARARPRVASDARGARSRPWRRRRAPARAPGRSRAAPSRDRALHLGGARGALLRLERERAARPPARARAAPPG